MDSRSGDGSRTRIRGHGVPSAPAKDHVHAGFFRAVAAIRKQLRSAEGLVGYTLRAKPLARAYWTLAVWTDGVALEQFMRTPPHLGVMSSLKPHMGPTKYHPCKITSRDGRPDGNEALERLARE